MQEIKSLITLMDCLDTEEKAIKYYQKYRWNGKPICPYCKCDRIYSFSDGIRFKCAECRRQFNVKIGSEMEGSKLPVRKWIMAIYFATSHKKGISAIQLAKDIEVTEKTALFMLHRLRKQLGLDNPTDGQQLAGNVQADESFVGGKNKNRHWDKKVPHSQGRAHIDKTPVLGLLQEEVAEVVRRPHKVIPGKFVNEKIILQPAVVKLRVIETTGAKIIQPIVRELVEKGAKFTSDEWLAYQGLNADYDHRVIDHGRGQYVNEAGDTTNAIEGTWSLLKRSIFGIYHACTKRRLQLYVNEVEFRRNTIHLGEIERVNRVIGIKGKQRLRYRDLINDNGQKPA